MRMVGIKATQRQMTPDILGMLVHSNSGIYLKGPQNLSHKNASQGKKSLLPLRIFHKAMTGRYVRKTSICPCPLGGFFFFFRLQLSPKYAQLCMCLRVF